MSIDQDLDALLAAPKPFLEANALVIYGSTKGGSQTKDFVLQATSDVWKTSVGGSMKAAPVYVMYDADGFNAKGVGPQSRRFNAHYISMREYDVRSQRWEDAGATHYTLPGAGGPTVMVTSKLNGCTFGIGSDGGGTRLVSHLRPPTALGGTAARLRLDEGTRAGFSEGKLDVSVMSSTEQNGTVLGLRTGSRWTFYAQRFQMLVGAGIIGAVQVYG